MWGFPDTWNEKNYIAVNDALKELMAKTPLKMIVSSNEDDRIAASLQFEELFAAPWQNGNVEKRI